MSAFRGRRNDHKLGSSGGGTTEVFSVPVLEARSPRLGQAGSSPSRGSGREFFCAPSSFWWPTAFLELGPHPSNPCLFSSVLLALALFLRGHTRQQLGPPG